MYDFETVIADVNTIYIVDYQLYKNYGTGLAYFLSIETKPITIDMKTKKIKLACLSFTLLLVTVTIETIADRNSNPGFTGNINYTESNYFAEYFSYEEMNRTLDIQLKPEVNVKIFNSENQLIATGNETEDKVKSLVKVADLLTEIDGTQYYRLSYK